MKINKEGIVVYLFSFSLIVDVLNNILLTILKTNFGIVAAFKSIILLSIILLLRNKYAILGLFFLIIIFLIRQMIILHMYDLYTFANDLIVSSRFFLFYVSLFLLYEYRYSKVINKLIRVFYIFVIIQCLSIWLGYIFKIDFFNAYEWRGGYKGLLYGINDVAFFMALSYLYATYLLVKEKQYVFFTLVLSATFILGLGSRGALLSIIVISYFTWFYYSIYGKTISKLIFFILNILFLLIFFIFILPEIYFLLKIFMEQSLRVFEGSGSILTTILSYRDHYIIDYFHSIKNTFSFLFGVQFPYKRDMIESDLFDLLYRFGLFGLIFYYYVIIKLSQTIYKNYFKTILMIIIILMGWLMGHVLLSSINAIWIALFLIYYSNSSITGYSK